MLSYPAPCCRFSRLRRPGRTCPAGEVLPGVGQRPPVSGGWRWRTKLAPSRFRAVAAAWREDGVATDFHLPVVIRESRAWREATISAVVNAQWPGRAT